MSAPGDKAEDIEIWMREKYADDFHSLVAHPEQCQSDDWDSTRDLLDAIRECERLRAENARLQELRSQETQRSIERNTAYEKDLSELRAEVARLREALEKIAGVELPCIADVDVWLQMRGRARKALEHDTKICSHHGQIIQTGCPDCERALGRVALEKP